MSLRDHLLAAQAGQSIPTTTSPTSPHEMHIAYSSPGHHIDPAIGGSPGQTSPMGDLDPDALDPRKGRRELSTSKRAAQNRAAQRAFRQRKEHYIQSLKDQVKEHQTLAQNYEAVQKDNFQLRQYIITLQARLLESHTELPPPPATVDLTHGPPVLGTAPTAQMTPTNILENQLQAAAAAAAAEDTDSRRHLSFGDSKTAEVHDGSGGAAAANRDSSD